MDLESSGGAGGKSNLSIYHLGVRFPPTERHYAAVLIFMAMLTFPSPIAAQPVFKMPALMSQ